MKAALKLCLFTSLLGCLPAVAADPVLPAGLVGNYQALLYTGADITGTPAGLVTITTMATGKVSGKVTTDENKTYPFTSTFNYVLDTDVVVDEDNLVGTSVTAAISIPRPKLTALSLNLTILHNTDGPVLKVVLSLEGAPNRIADSGFLNVKFAPKVKADWEGKYTLALEGAEEPATGEPEGSGYATGAVLPTGVLNLAGKTGDGVAFTASLPAGPNRNYVAYLNPYKTATSFLAGRINLVARTDAGFHATPAESPNYDFRWKKAAKAGDKSYPAGFGSSPIGLLVTAEPWIAPKGQTLSELLGLTDDKVFNFAFEGDFATATYAARIPTKLALTSKNVFRVAAGLTGSPSPILPALWSKFFTSKIDPASGKISASLTIVDSVPTANPLKPKLVTRKIVIEGVMLQLEEGDDSPFAHGFVQIPPLDAKIGTTICDRFAFTGPVVEDPLIATVAATAGNYTVKVNQTILLDLDGFSGPGVSINVTGTMKAIPDDDAVVPFTIAADLSYIIFNGRKLGLQGDSRPVALAYSDLSASNVKNSLTVIVYIGFDGVPTGVNATYLQLLTAKITATIPGYGTRTVSGLIPSSAAYLDNDAPVKVVTP